MSESQLRRDDVEQLWPYTKTVSDLPLEILEIILMRAFLMIYVADEMEIIHPESPMSERLAFTQLAFVCSFWRYTLTGWPQSPTRHWLRHQLRKCIEYVVWGVAQALDVIYIVCYRSSAILRYWAATHKRLTDIVVDGLANPTDIAACEHTAWLYIADRTCVWRVSAEGADIQRWVSETPPDEFLPYSLSVTSTRVLVTFRGYAKQLRQFDEDGNELRRIRPPLYMEPRHGVESSASETFIVCHGVKSWDRVFVSELSAFGDVLRQFACAPRCLSFHLAVDWWGNVLLTDDRRIIVLDAEFKFRRVLIDELQLSGYVPYRLCYSALTGQLLVVTFSGFLAGFDVLRR